MTQGDSAEGARDPEPPEPLRNPCPSYGPHSLSSEPRKATRVCRQESIRRKWRKSGFTCLLGSWLSSGILLWTQLGIRKPCQAYYMQGRQHQSGISELVKDAPASGSESGEGGKKRGQWPAWDN